MITVETLQTLITADASVYNAVLENTTKKGDSYLKSLENNSRRHKEIMAQWTLTNNAAAKAQKAHTDRMIADVGRSMKSLNPLTFSQKASQFLTEKLGRSKNDIFMRNQFELTPFKTPIGPYSKSAINDMRREHYRLEAEKQKVHEAFEKRREEQHIAAQNRRKKLWTLPGRIGNFQLPIGRMGLSAPNKILGGALGGVAGMFSGQGPVAGTMMGLQGGILGAATAGIEGLINQIARLSKKGIQLAADYQEAKVAFQTLFGGKETGTKLLENVQQFAINTPFKFKEMQESAKLLAGFGVQANNILPSLKAIGELTAGIGGGSDRFQHIALAFAQTQARGHLAGEEMRQFANAGVGIGDFAATMGVTVNEFQELMHSGQVSSAIVLETFNRMTSAGGRFHNLMKLLAQTAKGRFNSITESWDMVLQNIGLKVIESPGLLRLFDKVDSFLLKLKNSTGIGDFIAGGWDLIGEVFDKLIKQLPEISTITSVIEDGWKKVRIVISGIETVLTTITDLWKSVSGIAGGNIGFKDIVETLSIVPALFIDAFKMGAGIMFPLTQSLLGILQGLTKLAKFTAGTLGYKIDVDTESIQRLMDANHDNFHNFNSNSSVAKAAVEANKNQIDALGMGNQKDAIPLGAMGLAGESPFNNVEPVFENKLRSDLAKYNRIIEKYKNTGGIHSWKNLARSNKRPWAGGMSPKQLKEYEEDKKTMEGLNGSYGSVDNLKDIISKLNPADQTNSYLAELRRKLADNRAIHGGKVNNYGLSLEKSIEKYTSEYNHLINAGNSREFAAQQATLAAKGLPTKRELATELDNAAKAGDKFIDSIGKIKVDLPLLSGELTKFVNKTNHNFHNKEGTYDMIKTYDDFLKYNSALIEAAQPHGVENGGMGLAALGGVGIALTRPAEITDKVKEFGQIELFKHFEKDIAKGLEIKNPELAYQGSSKAQDTINRSNQPQLTVAERTNLILNLIKETLDNSSKDRKEYEAVVKDWMNKPVNSVKVILENKK